jgi:predicted CoA-binding protein
MGVAEMERALKIARSIAVLGIKPESRCHLDAHRIPLYLQKVGYDILPVPTRYPEAAQILDRCAIVARITARGRPRDASLEAPVSQL